MKLRTLLKIFVCFPVLTHCGSKVGNEDIEEKGCGRLQSDICILLVLVQKNIKF